MISPERFRADALQTALPTFCDTAIT